jgi:hypothetical protein
MNKLSRISAARRNAEATLSKAQKRDSDLKIEQQRELEAMAQKTARLRALRLEKEAAEQAATTANPAPRARPKVRRSKHT